MSVISIRGSDGNMADVRSDARLVTKPKTDFEKAVAAGLAFSWANATYDYAASDTILGLQNDSDVYDLCIEWISATGSTATEIIVHTSSAVTMAGTAVTGVNLNRNYSSTPTALSTAKADETGNGQAAASYSGRIVTGRIANAGWIEWRLAGALVLPADHNVGIDFVTDGTAANCVIHGYFRAR
jgi:hypothetical protein